MVAEQKVSRTLFLPNPERQVFLRLYIAGRAPRSRAALSNLRRICDTYLASRHRLEVVDLAEDPGRAGEDQILAIPTLVKLSPLPVARLIGDLSDTPRVLRGLDVEA